MPQQQTNDWEMKPVSRRRLLLATLLGGTIAAVNQSASRACAEQSSDRVIQLEPISVDFQSTVVQAIAADPRGKLIAVAGDDHAIRILDTLTLEIKHILQGHTDLIQSLHFDSLGDRLVSAGNDGQLMFWHRNDNFKELQRMQGPPAWACIRFAPDGGEVAAVGFENKVHLISRVKRSKTPEVTCDCTDLRAVDYRWDGKVLAVAGRSGDIHLFDRVTSKLLVEERIHTGRIHSLRFVKSSPVVVSVGEDGCVVMYDTEEQRVVSSIKVAQGKLYTVCILDRQHLAVAGSDNVIHIVNVTLGKTVKSLTGHTGTITALESVGSLLFSGGYDTTLRRWGLSGLEGVRERIAERENPIDR